MSSKKTIRGTTRSPPPQYSKLTPESEVFVPTVMLAKHPLTREFLQIASKMTSKTLQKEKPDHQVHHGPVPINQDLNVVRNDAGAVLSAFAKRIDYVPQEHVGEAFKKGIKELRRIIGKPMSPIVVTELDYQKWLKTQAPGKQQEIERLRQEPLYWQSYDYFEVFAKPEITLKPEGSDARAIHTQDRTGQFMFGLITNILNERLADVLQENNPNMDKDKVICYPCGKSDIEVAQLKARHAGKPVEGDYSSNDATIPRDARRYIAQVLGTLGAPEWWLKLFLGITDITAYSRQLGIKVEVKGQNHSGETTVTLVNCINTLAVALGSFEEMKLSSYFFMVYGDDSLAFVPDVKNLAEDVAVQMEESARDHGMKLKVACPSREQATFLQTRVYETGSKIIPVPKLGRIISKLNLRSNTNQAVNNNEYYAGKYLSAAHKLRFFPKIRDTLIAVSETLSAKPYMERDHIAANVAGNLRRGIDRSKHFDDEDLAAEAVLAIYNLPYKDICDDFAMAGIGVIQSLMGSERTRKIAEEIGIDKITLQGLESDTVLAMTRHDNT